MTPEEKRLIADLFERMRNFGTPEKDREAEGLIAQSVRAMPDAPYMLVQSVLVQEQALQQAGERMQELEDRVRQLEAGGQARAPGGSGSFLGGLLGGGRPAAEPRAGSSVPAIGSRAPGSPGAQSAWGRSAAPQAAPAQPQAAAPASGGFMRSAMATAAGVAGGMLVAEGIRNMMGGGAAQAGQKPAAASEQKEEQAAKEREDNNKEGAYDQEEAHDRATYEEPESDWGGGDFGGSE